MTSRNSHHNSILFLLLQQEQLRSSEIHTALLSQGEDISLITVKRALSRMMKAGLMSITGAGRSTAYTISTIGRLFTTVNATAYCNIEPDQRYGLKRFNFDIFPDMPSQLFTNSERDILERTTKKYNNRRKNISQTIAKKELERLIIELSWKSSKIEGNTYTLLDTEKLLLDHVEALGHHRSEAQMIINHKDAFTLIHNHTEEFHTLTKANLEHLHAVLIKDLGVGSGLRLSPVGVTGSAYRPLDNIHQIRDAIENLESVVSRLKSPYAKGLVALLGISYIQPFEDGNKRTARLMSNALLLANGCAPLSYRSVDENAYREAILVFYELNSLIPFKKIFIEQYIFAAENYAIM